MKSLRIRVLRSGYIVGTKEVSTVIALEAELIRLKCKVARVVPDKDTPYRKVAAAMRVLQRRRIFSGFVGNVRAE
jgi:hypothetical protein